MLDFHGLEHLKFKVSGLRRKQKMATQSDHFWYLKRLEF